MKKYIILFTVILIFIGPGYAKASGFGFDDIAKQYADINWNALKGLSGTSINTNNTQNLTSFPESTGSSQLSYPINNTGLSNSSTGGTENSGSNFLSESSNSDFTNDIPIEIGFTSTEILTDITDEYLTISDTNIENQERIAPVPEPATMLLLGSGLIGLAGLRKKYRKD